MKPAGGLAAGEIGEIVARVTSIPDFTYHGDDDKRARADRGGYFAPGDVGYFDPDGFLYICDRANDMVISGGVNIYPAEIEAELHKMPGVEDCAVFGIPDEDYGEALCVIIQPQSGVRLDAAGVRAFLEGKVARYKIPRRVEFRQDLPREDSGKIRKRHLRDEFWKDAPSRV